MKGGFDYRAAGHYRLRMTPHDQVHYVLENEAFIRDLVAAGARFVIVGGRAVRFHWPQRRDNDLDVLIDPTESNAQKLATTINEWCKSNVSDGQLVRPKVKMTMFPPLYLDIITPASRDEFCQIYNGSIAVRLSGMVVQIASIEALIMMKDGSGQEPDISDTIALRARLGR